jgi:hypothetical protein
MPYRNFGPLQRNAMRVIGIGTLTAFCGRVPECKNWLGIWLADMRGMQSPSFDLIKQRYTTATQEARSIIFTFHTKEVQYFMKVQVAVNTGVLTIVWVGSTTEYLIYKSEVSHGN